MNFALSPEQVTLVRRSHALLAPQAQTTALSFYDTLFRTDPALRGLFKGDLGLQGARLMTVLGMAVACLEDLPSLAPVLQQLGARHAAYGVKAVDYGVFGAAILETLASVLGAHFDDDTQAAWAALLGWISRQMLSGSMVELVAAPALA